MIVKAKEFKWCVNKFNRFSLDGKVLPQAEVDNGNHRRRSRSRRRTEHRSRSRSPRSRLTKKLNWFFHSCFKNEKTYTKKVLKEMWLITVYQFCVNILARHSGRKISYAKLVNSSLHCFHVVHFRKSKSLDYKVSNMIEFRQKFISTGQMEASLVKER